MTRRDDLLTALRARYQVDHPLTRYALTRTGPVTLSPGIHADVVAVDLWDGSLHGFYLATTRDDWDPAQLAAASRFLRRCYLVAPARAVGEPEDLPRICGLLTTRTDGTLAQRFASVIRAVPEPLPPSGRGDLARALAGLSPTASTGTVASTNLQVRPVPTEAPVWTRDDCPVWACTNPAPHARADHGDAT